ncbi:hypothetical protein ABW21_db0203078 [Orbilia brochopaga]|nr:hypothetical protein ABW21_db0203078 [Drechslerella brochopaga]
MSLEPYLIESFTEHTLEEDGGFPAEGTLIRLRLPRLINGPGSQGSSLVSSCYTPETPEFSGTHFAIVTGHLLTDNGLVVSVYPLMSFSKYKKTPAAERLNAIPKLCPIDKLLLLPLPHVKEDLSRERGWRQPETPEGFGAPLDCGEWINDWPAWLWAGTQVFDLFYGQSMGHGHSGGSSGDPSKFSGGNSRGGGGPASRGHQQKSGKYQKNHFQSGSSNNEMNHLFGHEENSSPEDTFFALPDPTFDDDMQLLDYLRSPERNDLAAHQYDSLAEKHRVYDNSKVIAWLEDS